MSRRDEILLQQRNERWQMACRIAQKYPWSAKDIEPLTRLADEQAIIAALDKSLSMSVPDPVWFAGYLLSMP